MKIGDFLKRVKDPANINPEKKYKLVTVKLYHKGVVLREEKLGSEIGSKMYKVKAGQFILSGIDARNGAFGIIPEELDGAVVTNDFWCFDIDDSVINRNLFLYLTATEYFDEICRQCSDGTTNRVRLQADKFFVKDVDLPAPNAQKHVLQRITKVDAKSKRLLGEIEIQDSLISKLRRSILQDAVQGKLVPQDSNDEPASELIKRILGQKKSKKVLTLESDASSSLPSGWVKVKLGIILSFEYGKNLPKKLRHESGNVMVYGSNGVVGFYDKYLTDKPAIIIGRKGSAGALNIALQPSWTTDVAYYCLPSREIDFDYIYIALKALKLEKLGKGIKPGLNRKEVYALRLSIPPLEEQKRIAAKVETLMAMCDELEQQIAQSKEQAGQLMKSVLQEAFAKA